MLNAEIDGTFPAHHPDPTVPKNLEQLIAAVAEHRADIGIALDGDADRIGVVDDAGHILFGDQIMVILGRDVLQQHPGATIIADVKASQVLFDEIARAGGKPLMWKTGHSLIKAKMAETGAPLAGEMSGHVFFADDGMGSMTRSTRRCVCSASWRGWTASSRGARGASACRQHAGVSLRLRRSPQVPGDRRRRRPPARGGGEGLGDRRRSGAYDDGWWLLRASNTQAVLVARAEATSEEGLERLKQDLVRHLEASGLQAPDFSGSHAGH